jgi:hypothetical protein
LKNIELDLSGFQNHTKIPQDLKKKKVQANIPYKYKQIILQQNIN